MLPKKISQKLFLNSNLKKLKIITLAPLKLSLNIELMPSILLKIVSIVKYLIGGSLSKWEDNINNSWKIGLVLAMFPKNSKIAIIIRVKKINIPKKNHNMKKELNTHRKKNNTISNLNSKNIINNRNNTNNIKNRKSDKKNNNKNL
jgi:hypothetical protein